MLLPAGVRISSFDETVLDPQRKIAHGVIGNDAHQNRAFASKFAVVDSGVLIASDSNSLGVCVEHNLHTDLYYAAYLFGQKHAPRQHEFDRLHVCDDCERALQDRTDARQNHEVLETCLLYTSDAADE